MKHIFSIILLTALLIGAGCDSTQEKSGDEFQLTDIEVQANVTPVEEMIKPSTFSRAVLDEDVVGSWYILEGGDAEEITLEEDGTFQTFLHSKPFELGVWKFDDGQLTLRSDALGVRLYTNVVYEEGFLFLEGEEDLYQMWGKVWEELNIE